MLSSVTVNPRGVQLALIFGGVPLSYVPFMDHPLLKHPTPPRLPFRGAWASRDAAVVASPIPADFLSRSVLPPDLT
eukprot:scaffold3944_cov48-Phaeocystis_antarctica.AAC.3